MDDAQADDFPSSPQAMGCLIAFLFAPIFLGFEYFGAPTRGCLVIALLTAYVLLLYLRRPIRVRSSTFAWLSFVLFVQLAAAFVAPLPDWPFSKGLLWLMIVPAFVLNYGILFVAERIFGGLKAVGT